MGAVSESTIARMAGNVAGALIDCAAEDCDDDYLQLIAERSVQLARFIAAEVKRTSETGESIG